jgi:hypothetical protein
VTRSPARRWRERHVGAGLILFFGALNVWWVAFMITTMREATGRPEWEVVWLIRNLVFFYGLPAGATAIVLACLVERLQARRHPRIFFAGLGAAVGAGIVLLPWCVFLVLSLVDWWSWEDMFLDVLVEVAVIVAPWIGGFGLVTGFTVGALTAFPRGACPGCGGPTPCAACPRSMHCRRCRYDLRALVGSACPECGRSFDPAEPWTYAYRKPRAGWCNLLIGVIVLVYAPLYAAGHFWWFAQMID